MVTRPQLCCTPTYVRRQHDDRLVKDYGVKYAIETVQKIWAAGDIQGFHFCTLNLEKSVQRVLEGLQWTGSPENPTNKLIVV